MATLSIKPMVRFISLASFGLLVLPAGAEQRAAFLKPAVSAPDSMMVAAQPTLPPPQQERTTDPQRSTLTPPDQPAHLTQPSQPVVIDEAMPAPQGGASRNVPQSGEPMNLRPTPHVVYDTDSDARRMYACYGSVDMIMVTQNPADKCFYEIPLCIPACCVGEPTMSSKCGLFGRGVVTYCWPCGFEAIVKFRNIGDVRVDYEGD
jgi:hypothetical protein